ncbi:MAG: hypothetical protein EA422_07570 [Gemmatimonadales bacterium]|nr:MAG: hypothetical protein EA422_07570 [Gemmatimonadales bacterium]
MTCGDGGGVGGSTLRPGRMAVGRRFRGAVWLLALLFLVACHPRPELGPTPGVGTAAAPERDRIVLLHDSDTHFHDNHRAQVRAFVESVRGAGVPVFLLSAGDFLVRHEAGWPEGEGIDGYQRMGRTMLERMGELGYDVATPGNHDIYPVGSPAGELLLTRELLESAPFPLIAANLRVETALLPPFPPYHLLETAGGRTVAVLGLATVNFDPPEGLEMLDPEEVVASHLALAQAHDALVLLSHLGIRPDLDLAIRFPEVDAILGGHTHTLLPEAVQVNGVLVAHPGGQDHRAPDAEAAALMGVVVLEFEGDELVEQCGWVLAIGPDGPLPSGRFTGSGLGWEAPVPAC